MKRLQLFMVASVCLSLFVGCPSPVNTSLVVQPVYVNFESDGNGFSQFETNSFDTLGSSFDDLVPNSSPTLPEVITATVVKNSGAANYGYGVVFGHDNNHQFYSVLVAENGYYIVFKQINGTIISLQPWTQSSNVHVGFGVQNVIDVQFDGTYYQVYINNLGTPVFQFSPDPDLGTNGSAGFFASVGSAQSEKFPGTPVDVRFKMTSPFSFPVP